jgi:hypothetical protein
MYLQHAVSYGNAWGTLAQNFSNELNEIEAVIAAMTPEAILAARPLRDISYQNEPGITRFRLEGCWTEALQSRGWEECPAAVQGAGGWPIHMRGLGHVKNQVSVAFHRHRELINRWLYTLGPIATRNDLVEIPICVTLTARSEEILFGRRPTNLSVFERLKEELVSLSPLSHANPFLLLGIGLEAQELEILELEPESNRTGRHVVINRSIEFPPAYHQAGLGILAYFGTVLREKYPDHNATVRIEQDGLRVRLVIESENGDKEVIEKALQEYELVVLGETQPEEFFSSKAKVLELKNELRIAQVRIETQKDLIAYHGEEIASLRQLMGHALTTAVSRPISVVVSPTITINTATAIQLQQNAPLLSEYVQELSQLAGGDPDVELRLLDLEQSLALLAKKETPEAVKGSTAMKKLKKLLDEANETGSAINVFLQKANAGVELAQKMARGYNSLAEWCGAPQVPSVFLGSK